MVIDEDQQLAARWQLDREVRVLRVVNCVVIEFVDVNVVVILDHVQVELLYQRLVLVVGNRFEMHNRGVDIVVAGEPLKAKRGADVVRVGVAFDADQKLLSACFHQRSVERVSRAVLQVIVVV